MRAALERRGASFFDELVAESGLLATRVERALGELAASGHVTSDSFTGLRALLTPSDRRPDLGGARWLGREIPNQDPGLLRAIGRRRLPPGLKAYVGR